MASNTSTISSTSSLRSSKRIRENKTLPNAKRALINEDTRRKQKQNEVAVEDMEQIYGKTTRSGRKIGLKEDGSRPGEVQVSPGTT